MAELKNSDVIENLLKTLINISSRKTSRGYALNTIDTVMKNLKDKYDFLKYIKIIDNRFIEDKEPINIMSDINNVKSDNVGKALNEIINTTQYSLGDKAGHFFIKEIRTNIGGDYSSIMKEMGVDLGLMQLEKEVNDLNKAITHKK
jgi:hypothetical protein